MNYSAAADICQKRNATLPRIMPIQPVSSLNAKFMQLSSARGHFLHIWLNSNETLPTYYIWAIDSYTTSRSHQKAVHSGVTSGVHIIVCERGKVMMYFYIHIIVCERGKVMMYFYIHTLKTDPYHLLICARKLYCPQSLPCMHALNLHDSCR